MKADRYTEGWGREGEGKRESDKRRGKRLYGHREAGLERE